MQSIEIPSICVPRVYINFDQAYVEAVFFQLFGPNLKNETCIERIDMIQRQDRNTQEPFYVVFVHFKKNMPRTKEIEIFVETIEKGEEVKISYKYPWFWKVRKNNGKRRGRVEGGPRMILNEEDMKEIKKHQNELKNKQEKQPEKQPETQPETN